MDSISLQRTALSLSHHLCQWPGNGVMVQSSHCVIGIFSLSRTGLRWRASFMAASLIFLVRILCPCSSQCCFILTLWLIQTASFQYVCHSSGPASINALVSSKLLTSHYTANIGTVCEWKSNLYFPHNWVRDKKKKKKTKNKAFCFRGKKSEDWIFCLFVFCIAEVLPCLVQICSWTFLGLYFFLN